MTPRPCGHASLVPGLLAGTLTEAERRRVERHLADCGACREELIRLEAVVARLVTEMQRSRRLVPDPNPMRMRACIDRIAATLSTGRDGQARQGEARASDARQPAGSDCACGHDCPQPADARLLRGGFVLAACAWLALLVTGMDPSIPGNWLAAWWLAGGWLAAGVLAIVVRRWDHA